MANSELQILLSLKDNASKELKNFQGKVQKMKPAFRKMAMVGTAAFAGLSLGVYKATQAASDAEETFNKFDVVFQDVKTGADSVAQNLQDNFGLAESTAKSLLSATGDMLTGFGMTGEQALDLADKTNKLAVDLASFTNIEGGAERASKALTKALLGERESVKELGIAILEKDVKAKIKAMEAAGKFTDETDRQKKALATLEIAIGQSKNAIGDYERTQDSLANQQRLLKERTKEMSEELGAVFIPLLKDLVKMAIPVVNKIMAWIKENPKLTKTIVIVAGALTALVAVIGILGLMLGPLAAGFSFLLGPIGLVIAIIVGLIAIGVLLYKNWDTIKANAVRIWTSIKDFFINIWDELRELFDTGLNFIKDLWNNIWDGISNMITGVWEGIKSTIKSGINWVIDKLNGFVRAANKITQKMNIIPGVNIPLIPEIPFLAKGGIVQKPTLAMVGEAGPEAVIPLNKKNGMGNITVNINGGYYFSDEAAEELGNKIIDNLKLQLAI